MTTLTQQIEAARLAVREAASKGYAVFVAAQRELARLEEQRAVEQFEAMGNADEEVYVVGDTYRHRNALKAAGLKWDADRKAWRGPRRLTVSLPAGVRVVDYGTAALRTMDYADSIY